MKKNKIFICHVPTSQILVHLQLCHVGCQLVQVGQVHVVAIDVAQVGIGIGRHREFVSLELVSGEWEDFIFEARVVVGDAHAGGDDLVGQQATKDTKEGEKELVVEVEDATHLFDALGVVSARTPNLVHVSNGLLREFV